MPELLAPREYFAALALQGLAANPNGVAVHDDAARLASVAVALADALLAALRPDDDACQINLGRAAATGLDEGPSF